MVLAVALLAVQIVVLPGAQSPFRLPKEAVALGSLLLVVGFDIARRLRRGDLALPAASLTTVLVSLPLLQAISAVWAPSPRRAIESALTSAVWIVAALWIATLEERQRRLVVVWCSAGAAISACVMLLQAAGLRFLVTSAGSARAAMTGLTGNPADLAMAAVLLLPLVLSAPGDAPRRRLWWILPVVLAAAAALSLTLTGYVALSAVALTWLLMRRSARLWMAAAGVAAVVAALAFATGLDERLERQLWRIQHGDWYSLLSARPDGWTAAVQMALEQPLLGVGAGNYTVAFYPSRLSWLETHGATGGRGELATHFEWAHCDPLQMAAELGLLGVAWMVALAVAIVRIPSRGDPVVPLAAAAATPFLLLHYPTHLAVGIIPLILLLARLLHPCPRVALVTRGSATTTALAVLVVVGVAFGAVWQLQRLALDMWRGGLEHALVQIERAPPEQRAAASAAIEVQIAERIQRLPGASPWLWRVMGRARMLRGEAPGAEMAFRRAMGTWPHEEAELGLALSLAAQGRRGEAMVHIGRVCRVNPALVQLIQDPDLRRAATDLVRARSGRR